MDINKEIEEKITVASADIGGKTSKKTSFKKIAKQALEHAAVVVEHFVPGGEIQGDYFVALNPTRADQNLGSFKLNLKTGQWGEFRPGFEASGSDLTSWVSYVKGISQGQAAKLITQFLATVDKPQIKSARLQKVDVWTPISAPAEAEDAGKTMFGNILNRTATYEYRNADDKVVCFVHRCDSAGHKSFLLQSFCEGPDGKREWRYQGPCIPRSLYRLDVLTHRPDSPVLVCEGEKSADAAQSLFPDYVCVTSMNGAKSAAKSDWSPLKGRLVSLWADNDDAGLKYVAEVAVILRNIDPTITLSLLKPITVCAGNDAKGQPVLTPGFNAPEGWDAANAVDEGWTADHMKLLGDDAWEELPVTVQSTAPVPLPL